MNPRSAVNALVRFVPCQFVEMPAYSALPAPRVNRGFELFLGIEIMSLTLNLLG